MEATNKRDEANETLETSADVLADLSVAGEEAESTKGGTVSSGSIQVLLGDASVRSLR